VRSFLQNSSAPTKEVSVGDVAYAVSIDINGMTQQAYIGPENLRFFIPRGASVINGDGIAILKGAPNMKIAREFVNFVLSERGQRLWMVPRGQPGGPRKFDISRMSVLPALYEGDLSGLLVPLNPFKDAQSVNFNNSLSSQRWSVLNALIGNTIIDVHSHLRAAWREIISLSPDKREQLLKEFSAPFASEQEISEISNWWRKDKVRAGRQSNAWMFAAVQRYNSLEKRARELRKLANQDFNHAEEFCSNN
jgi:spermidine/putrescine-binding protein